MFTVQVDEHEIRKITIEQIAEKVKQVDAELVFWDSAELKRRTCMSWDTIQTTFFHDPRFPKHKVGGKWYYPVSKTKDFLLNWIEEQNVK